MIAKLNLARKTKIAIIGDGEFHDLKVNDKQLQSDNTVYIQYLLLLKSVYNYYYDITNME